MASRILLRTKPDPKLSLQFLRNPVSVYTRAVSWSSQHESTNESKKLYLYKLSTYPMILNPFAPESSIASVGIRGFSLAGGAVFARQMGTGRSSSRPRGGSNRDYEDDDFGYGDYDKDIDGVDDFDDNMDDDDDFDDEDFDDEDDIEEEDEENPKKKTHRRY